MPADDGAEHATLQLHPGIGRPAAAALQPVLGDGELTFQVHHGKVGVIAHRDTPLGLQAEDALHARAGHVDQAIEGHPPVQHMVEHQRQQRLHARHAAGAGGVGPGLFLNRVGRVTIDMLAAADRRVHLGIGAKAGIGFLAAQ
ncbi:hypothetical protein E4T56_gene17504, partial [Termitomyces sp. T112]